MSHWTTVKTQIKSLRHLAEAARELGLQYEEAKGSAKLMATGYNNTKRPCIARIHGGKDWRYDIAVDQSEDGTFSLTTDWYDRKEHSVGFDFAKLKQGYAVAVATAKIKAKGWTARKRVLSDGTIQLVASGM